MQANDYQYKKIVYGVKMIELQLKIMDQHLMMKNLLLEKEKMNLITKLN